ncbi:glycosyltransferase family 2 protein [Candidatus Daviesbacteria bacterium]|nr:glycosyltransferase family 2 protein [Candidatus Daviesbacteria bacterium]
MDKIAIVTVNYNNTKDTLEFLESLKKLDTSGLDVKTVVVDNGSSDTSVEDILKKFPNVDLVQTDINKGFSGGYNRGMEYSLAWGADYILIINNDTLINSKDLCKELIKTAKSSEKIGLVSPKIYFAPGFEFHKDRYSDKDRGKVIWYGGGEFDFNNVYSKHRGIDEVDSGKYDQVEQTNLITGCCMLIKKEVLEKVGMFDEDLFAYMEDNDFSLRTNKLGFKKFYNGTVSIYHKVSQTTGIGSFFTDYFHTRNRLIFGFKYASFKTKFALIREAIKFLIVGRKAQKKAVLDFLKGVKGAPEDLINKDTGSHLGGVTLSSSYQKKLSVVIVNYNTANLVKALLKSIYDKKSGIYKQSTEVVVLDNGKLNPVGSFMKDYPQARYIENPENTGFSGGYNRAMKFTRGEYILMLNSDIEVLENSLAEITKATEEFKGEAVLGGRLYFPDMSNQDSVFNLPTITGAFKEYFLAQKGAYFMYLPLGDKPVKVQCLVMACFLIPRKILNRVGYLDEDKFIFFEDVEYCRRLKEYEVPIYFIPTAKFIHHHGASTKKLKEGEAYKQLVKSSKDYHGKIYYFLLTSVLWLGQKLGKVKIPVGS